VGRSERGFNVWGSEPTPTIYLNDMDDDEFSQYNLTEFTEEDFLYVDIHIAESSRVKGGPTISVEVEEPTSMLQPQFQSMATHQRTSTSARRSPIQQFRNGNRHLSVSDLTSPAWYDINGDLPKGYIDNALTLQVWITIWLWTAFIAFQASGTSPYVIRLGEREYNTNR